MAKEIWRKEISFKESGNAAWGELVELMQKKGIDHDGHFPVYIRINRWEGDKDDSIEISNGPFLS